MATKDDLHRLVDQLAETETEEALVLLVSLLRDKGYPVPDYETKAWLDADLAPPLPPWEWAPGGPPEGKPVVYVPGSGLVIEGD